MAELWSLTRLALELERDRQALARALKDLPPDEETISGRGTDRRWKLARVVNHLTAGSSEFDDQRERLAAAQADKVEMENAIRRGQIADLGEVERAWGDKVAFTRSRFLVIPSKLSTRLVNIGDPNIIAAAIRAEVYGVLAELTDYRPEVGAAQPTADAPAGVPAVGAAADPDGQPVGRRKPKTQQREQRGAGTVADR